MRVAVLVLAASLVGGCGLFRPEPPPVVEETPGERACRVEAAKSPESRALLAQANPSVEPNTERLAAERALAENRAFVECLRARGLASRGGVEAPRAR